MLERPARFWLPPAMLDCAAHMLLYLDEPQAMQRIALEHLLDRFAATRVAIGLGTPYDPKYQVCATQGGRTAMFRMSSAYGVAQSAPLDSIDLAIRRSSLPRCSERPDRAADCGRRWSVSERALKLARRLELGDRSFGIVCVAQTEERRRGDGEDHFT